MNAVERERLVRQLQGTAEMMVEIKAGFRRLEEVQVWALHNGDPDLPEKVLGIRSGKRRRNNVEGA